MDDFSMFSRETMIRQIAKSSIIGHLGLFVGTGFSKAATNKSAPDFEHLLISLARELHLQSDFDKVPDYKRKSHPQIASQLLKDYCAANQHEPSPADIFKDKIAQLCNISPDKAIRYKLSCCLTNLMPNWIITTNYDLILEALIDSAISILPTQPLVVRSDRVPIYHIHGHRHNPASIKITEEDYISLLGPIDYLRLKLPLLLLESTTLFLGYSIGDINVRAAMEWSRTFQEEQGLQLNGIQRLLIQAIHSESPRPEPYQGPNGEYILEIDDIPTFLESIANERNRLMKNREGSSNSNIELMTNFIADKKKIQSVSTCDHVRAEFLNLIKNSISYKQPTQLIEFTDCILDPIWEKAREDKQFEYYDVYLKLVLDILEQIDHREINPGFMSYLGDALDRVGRYIGNKKSTGFAFTASTTWNNSHTKISDDKKHELLSYAKANYKIHLLSMLQLVMKYTGKIC